VPRRGASWVLVGVRLDFNACAGTVRASERGLIETRVQYPKLPLGLLTRALGLPNEVLSS